MSPEQLREKNRPADWGSAGKKEKKINSVKLWHADENEGIYVYKKKKKPSLCHYS